MDADNGLRLHPSHLRHAPHCQQQQQHQQQQESQQQQQQQPQQEPDQLSQQRPMPMGGRMQQGEPDSGISSARSTGTVPWSHNEVGLPVLQVGGTAGADREQGQQEEHQL